MIRSRMKPWRASRAAVGLCLALAMSLALAGPAAAAGDMNLGSGDCAPAGSSTNAIVNACQSNTGAITLVASYRPPMPVNQFEALEAAIDVFTSPALLSPWWHMESNPSPGCRAGRISVNFNFTSGPFTCVDFWSGQALGGMDYGLNEAGFGPNTARIRVVSAVQEALAGSISTSTEYYAFSIVIQKNQSTGPGNCEGCMDRACFSLNSISLEQPAPVDPIVITRGTQTVVTYNGGTGGPNCAAAVVQKSSWGQIKAIYRY
jgi:hypothetical protein